MSENVLIIRDINKTYRYNRIENPAIRDFNLTVQKGEIICLFGRSGCGKTTLLNLIGCIDNADSGEIIISGKNTRHIPPAKMPLFRRKNIGFVFQFFNLIPYLTALENVALPLKYDGVPSAERKTRATEILDRLGIKDRLDFTMANLSGGQIQRVSFARAVITNPAIVLADEPTGQLDTQSAGELAEIITQLNRERHQTFIIATHDPAIISICHKTVYMEDGKMIQLQEFYKE